MSRPTTRTSLTLIAAFGLASGVAFSVGAMTTGDDDALVGSFSVRDRNAHYLVAAPHGDFDTHTDKIVSGFCDRVPWNCIVATGFETEGPRINVNRPTEGVRLGETEFSPRARRVYRAYMEQISALNPRLELYVEVHGNNHPESRHLVEIASAGISKAWALAIREALDEALKTHGLSHLSTRIDVIDDVRYGASHNREFGALSMIQPALHIELPMDARFRDREAVIEALSAALPQIARFDEAETVVTQRMPRDREVQRMGVDG
ncbi:MAG: hypothetical protein OXU20_34625 [Myxococcales bacterium]|nr:hypothetical protein [Myxococcales bacterium]MDD9967763.1 hypothetical protein [Myxococcales bacterium]